MKIALFTETYLPYINGVVTHVKALKDGLEKLGNTVMVVTADPDTKRHFVKDGILHCPAVTFKRVYNYGLASPVSIKRLTILKEFEPDVIHIHNEFGVGLSGTIIADILGVPLVYTLHTMYDDYLYYLVPEKLVPTLRTISHKYFKYLSNHASALTGPSSKCEEFFKECGATKSVSVVPNPVELDVFNPTHVNKTRATMLRQSYNVAADDTLIAFCGRLGREKSVDVLLNNWSKHVLHDDKLKLMILGEGPCLEELKEQAKSLNIDDSVVFVGRVEHEKLPDYYGACDLYVTASLSDTNSISMKEAMAIGLPVVHIYDPLNAGQVTNGINGFIYKDSDEMYKIFKRFQSMSEIEKLDLKNSVVNSVKKFGCEALAKYLIDVYQEAIIKKKYEVK